MLVHLLRAALVASSLTTHGFLALSQAGAARTADVIVPVALSCTHVAISSIRVEPTWMILGQSAGIAAALASKQSLPVQELPYRQLRPRLLAQGQVLDLPELAPLPAGEKDPQPDQKDLPGIILDDSVAQLEGHWKHSTNFKQHLGKGYLHDDDRSGGESKATFRFRAPAAGAYELRMAYSPHPTRAKAVPVTVRSGTLQIQLTVDQTQPIPSGQLFRKIATVQLAGPEEETTITLSNTATSGFVILDGLQLLPVEQLPDGQ